MWTTMIDVLGPKSAPKRRRGFDMTYIPILGQHQTRNCDRLGFDAAEMHWMLVAWSEGISRHLVCS